MADDMKTRDVTVLNDLVSLCIDSARDLRSAAEQAHNTSLSAIFLERASDRDRVLLELQDEVRAMGGTAVDRGSLAGAAHRAVLDVRAAAGNNVKSAIEEIERSEDVLRGHFEKAMYRKDISPATQQLVSRCCAGIREGHDEIWALKHAAG